MKSEILQVYRCPLGEKYSNTIPETEVSMIFLVAVTYIYIYFQVVIKLKGKEVFMVGVTRIAAP